MERQSYGEWDLPPQAGPLMSWVGAELMRAIDGHGGIAPRVWWLDGHSYHELALEYVENGFRPINNEIYVLGVRVLPLLIQEPA